jgi:alkaline phosphatase
MAWAIQKLPLREIMPKGRAVILKVSMRYLTGQYTHYALDKKTGKPDYVTDSAASATAWSTGVKTYNGALGVDIHEKDHMTILEMAKAAGLATGNVSTAELQDATPAALFPM